MNEAARAWWQSKKLAAVMGHYLVTTIVAIIGLIQYPSQAGAILAGFFGSASAVTVAHLGSQAATDRAQATSPNYPLPPQMVPDPSPAPAAPLSAPGGFAVLKPPS